MELRLYPATQGTDGAWRMRVVQSTKGLLGIRTEKTGFFKLDSEEEAKTAKDMIESGDVIVIFGSQQAGSDLYNLSVAAKPATVGAAKPAVQNAEIEH